MSNSKRRSSAGNDALSGMSEEEVIASLPEYITRMFQEVGFAKRNKGYLPVLFLNPFYVSNPPVVREEWEAYYDQFKTSEVVKMAHLVFWYGSNPDQPEFSLMGPNTILTYEQAAAKGLNVIPDKIAKKIEKGKKLTPHEDMFYFGLKDLEADRVSPKEERWTRDEPANDEVFETTRKEKKLKTTEEASQLPLMQSSPEPNNEQSAVHPETTVSAVPTDAQLPPSTSKTVTVEKVLVQLAREDDTKNQDCNILSPSLTLQQMLDAFRESDDIDEPLLESNTDARLTLVLTHKDGHNCSVFKRNKFAVFTLESLMQLLQWNEGEQLNFVLRYANLKPKEITQDA